MLWAGAVTFTVTSSRRPSLVSTAMTALPEAFAAIVPVCGGGMYWDARRLKETPVWAFHGAQDKTVLPEESLHMVEKVNAFGGNAKLTLYPNNAHDAWTDTYSNPEVYAWLLEHIKGEPV